MPFGQTVRARAKDQWKALADPSMRISGQSGWAYPWGRLDYNCDFKELRGVSVILA